MVPSARPKNGSWKGRHPPSAGSPSPSSAGSPMPPSTGSPRPLSAGSPRPPSAGSPRPPSVGSPTWANIICGSWKGKHPLSYKDIHGILPCQHNFKHADITRARSNKKKEDAHSTFQTNFWFVFCFKNIFRFFDSLEKSFILVTFLIFNFFKLNSISLILSKK